MIAREKRQCLITEWGKIRENIWKGTTINCDQQQQGKGPMQNIEGPSYLDLGRDLESDLLLKRDHFTKVIVPSIVGQKDKDLGHFTESSSIHLTCTEFNLARNYGRNG